MPKTVDASGRVSQLRDSATYLAQENLQDYWHDKPVWDLARAVTRSQVKNLRLFAEILERVGALESAASDTEQLRKRSALLEERLELCKYQAQVDRDELKKAAAIEHHAAALERQALHAQIQVLLRVCRAAQHLSNVFVPSTIGFPELNAALSRLDAA
jgi:hypothetical protein